MDDYLDDLGSNEAYNFGDEASLSGEERRKLLSPSAAGAPPPGALPSAAPAPASAQQPAGAGPGPVDPAAGQDRFGRLLQVADSDVKDMRRQSDLTDRFGQETVDPAAGQDRFGRLMDVAGSGMKDLRSQFDMADRFGASGSELRALTTKQSMLNDIADRLARGQITALDARGGVDALSQTNGAQYTSTNSVNGQLLAGALGMPDRTERIRPGQYRGDTYTVAESFNPRRSLNDWLEQQKSSQAVTQQGLSNERTRVDMAAEAAGPQAMSLTLPDGQVIQGVRGSRGSFQQVDGAKGNATGGAITLSDGRTVPGVFQPNGAFSPLEADREAKGGAITLPNGRTVPGVFQPGGSFNAMETDQNELRNGVAGYEVGGRVYSYSEYGRGADGKLYKRDKDTGALINYDPASFPSRETLSTKIPRFDQSANPAQSGGTTIPNSFKQFLQNGNARAPVKPPVDRPVQQPARSAADYKPGESVVRNGVTYTKREDGKWESRAED